MAASARLKRIERSLSPKQIVLLDIQEARRYPNIVVYGQAVLDGKALAGGTLCERIEASVRRSLSGMGQKAIDNPIRESQREGLFLANLFTECNSLIAAREKEIRLTGALVASQLLLTVWGRGHDINAASRLADGRLFADKHLRMLNGLRDAVRLIEREYFDGLPILFPDLESLMQECLDHALTLVEMFMEALRANTPLRSKRRRRSSEHDSPTTDENDAREHAMAWVMHARAKVHLAMGESAAGLQVMRHFLR